jgi:hypothetical protein
MGSANASCTLCGSMGNHHGVQEPHMHVNCNLYIALGQDFVHFLHELLFKRFYITWYSA